MNVAIVNPDTSEVENVIVVRDVAHAQLLFPQHECIERKHGFALEPNAMIVGKTIVRADAVTEQTKLDAKFLTRDIARLENAK